MAGDYNREPGNYGGPRDGGRSRGGPPHGGGRGPGGPGPRRSTPLSELDPALTSISHKVIGLATEIHMELGPGYPESVYLEAFKIELQAAGINFRAMQPIDVYFDDHVVGRVVADLLVDEKFIVDVMAAPQEIGSHERSQLRAQLRAADLVLGLIINFAGRRLKDGLVRVLNPDKLNADREGDHDEGDEPVADEPSKD